MVHPRRLVVTPLKLVERGEGSTVILIHGSAADHATWMMQLIGLARSHRVVAYDRRGSGGSPAAPAGMTLQDHADDAAEVIEATGAVPVAVCGSSFGAVVALELARRRPEVVPALVLCEPPLACADDVPAVPLAFGCRFDRIVATEGGPAAGLFFLRTVLGDSFDRLPKPWRERAAAEWRQIRADALALSRYQPQYRSLHSLTMPTLLVGGAQSLSFFSATLDTLELALPRTRRVTLNGGHMMHTEAAGPFNRAVSELIGSPALK